MKTTYLILATNDNRFVAIDSSCGYPYLTDDLRRVAYFMNEDEIIGYLRMFPQVDGKVLLRATLTMVIDYA